MSSRPGRCRPERRAAGPAGPQRPAGRAAASMGVSWRRWPPGPKPGRAPFQALVEAAGGRRQVLLVGELWGASRAARCCGTSLKRCSRPSKPRGKPGGGAAEGTGRGAEGTEKARDGARAIRSPLVFVLCRASSLAARGRGAACGRCCGMCEAGGGPARRWSGCWWPRRSRRTRRPRAAAAGGAAAQQERSAARREAQVQTGRLPPGHPASSLAVQAAACRACKPPGPGNQVRGREARAAWAGGGWTLQRWELFRPAPPSPRLVVPPMKLRPGAKAVPSLNLPARGGAEPWSRGRVCPRRTLSACEHRGLGKAQGQAEGRGGW